MTYASRDIPPCSGTLKRTPEDFCVDEIPLYEFADDGDHTLVRIRKTGISTFECVRRISKVLEYDQRNVGYAGMKDAHSVATQWLSFEHVAPERFDGLDIPKVDVIEVTRHRNKLKRGHLTGNRFEIRLRDVNPDDVPHARATLELLARRGVPNWFDTQRFGQRGDNARLGRALLDRDIERYFAIMLGATENEPDGETLAARRAYSAGDIDKALTLWPSRMNQERTILKSVVQHGATEKALRRVSKKLKRLHLSALQSALFNRVLAARLDTYDRVLAGEMCMIGNGAVFVSDDPASDQPRCDAFEISPTGPMFGAKMATPKGDALDVEIGVLKEAGLIDADWKLGGGLSQNGARRPLRFALTDSECVPEEGALCLKFTLPAGCFATVVVREITKGFDQSPANFKIF